MVNHNIRKNSKQEAQKVKKLLKKFDINLNILTNKSKINKNIGGQGHIHTTINTLKHRIDEIENENSITTL